MMNTKFKFKLMIDITMTILLLFLMARQITGDTAHEWLGAGMFILWLLHNVLNIRWYRNLMRGNYTVQRGIQTLVNFCLLLCMAGTMISAIILSKEVFVFLPVRGRISVARPLHVFSVFWVYTLMAVHLGLHWNMMISVMKRFAGVFFPGRHLWVLRVVAFGIAVYGLHAFVKNGFLDYMLLRVSFVYFDYERPALMFFLDYIAVMGLFIFIAHYGVKLVQTIAKRGLLRLPVIIGMFFITCSFHTNAETKAVPDSSQAEASIFAMNTVITLDAYGGNAQKAVSDAQSLIYHLERLLSVTDENSEISKINHSHGIPIKVSQETRALLRFSLGIAGETDGLLEPTLYPVLKAWGFTTGEYQIPDDAELERLLDRVDYKRVVLNGDSVTLPETMELDLGAVAKGYAGDLIRNVLKDNGVTSAIINLGGNVSLIGSSTRGEMWKVGIRSPHGDGNVGVLQAADTNIVTSGGYERYFIGEDGKTYGHILDPRNGRPVENGLLSVTIVSKDGKQCDALSTAMFVMGLHDAVEYWQNHNNFEMILFTQNDGIFITENLQDYFSLTQSYQGISLHIISANEGGY